MHLTAWATLAVLGVYFWTFANAAMARAKFKVPAPSMDGPVGFQSAHRVQMNTLEQLPLVLVPMWLCATYLGDTWAAAGGALWCVGRLLYATAYYKEPRRRESGFVTGMVASAFLIVCTVVGLLMHWN